MSLFQLKFNVVGLNILAYFAEFIRAALILLVMGVGCSMNVHESCK